MLLCLCLCLWLWLRLCLWLWLWLLAGHAAPLRNSTGRCRALWWRATGRLWCAPLGPAAASCTRLIGMRMDVLWHGSVGLAGSLSALQELQSGFDVHVVLIKLGRTAVRIQRVVGLVVAGFVLMRSLISMFE